MLYKKTESRVQPADTEEIAGGRYLIRRNITQESRTGADGETFNVWAYEEAVATAAEYAACSAVQEVESKREAEIVDEYTLQLIDEGVL